MSDSKVTIAGRRYTIRTGSLCTQFKSMDAAAEQIALLHEMIELLRADVAELEDCRERLRELGSYCGCDHVESADERGVQVRHIREAFARLRADNDRLYAAIRDILASPPAGVSNAVVSEEGRLP